MKPGHALSCRLALAVGLALLVGGCASQSPLKIGASDFATDMYALPDDWRVERFTGGRRMEELGASEAAGHGWYDTDSGGAALFHYGVFRFESVRLARRGYRAALRTYRIPGFRDPPSRDLSYQSTYADEYITFCGGQETTYGTCYSLARYVNLVVVVGLRPSDEVSLGRLPDLLEAVDRHIQAVIDRLRDPSVDARLSEVPGQ